MNRPKFHVKKGDQVEVISGVHKGAAGKVLQVLTKKIRKKNDVFRSQLSFYSKKKSTPLCLKKLFE